MLLIALKSIQMDEGFQVPSPEAAEALDAASPMLEWSSCHRNGKQLSGFCHSLVHSLRRCLPYDSEGKLDVGTMWGIFLHLEHQKAFSFFGATF